MAELLRTQLFASFIDERVVVNTEDLDVLYFEQSIDSKKNRSRFTLTKRDTPFLDSQQYVHTRVVVVPDPTHADEAERDGADEGGGGGRVYTYSRFPDLHAALLGAPGRPPPVPSTRQPKLRQTRAWYEGNAGVHSFETAVYSAWFVAFAATVDRRTIPERAAAVLQARAGSEGNRGRW